ncbi:hypothetical protein ScPMuIL_000714 [Solemya velum]
MEPPTLVSVPCSTPIKILKWKIKKGAMTRKGSILCLYETKNGSKEKLKSNGVGTVLELCGKEGDILPPGSVALKLQSCTHPTVMKDMCADCGADLRMELGMAGERKEPVSASVAMVHCIPELIVSEEQALELGREDEHHLLSTKKLVLLVDLDQTLIHTTNDSIPPNLKGVQHFQLWHGNSLMWYHTRIRPFTTEFLENISKLYQLHICTFGVRMYAHTIARFLDPEGKYFSHRILSRDECFSANSKTANLKALFPCGDAMVCIIDDREDVWNFAPNLIHVKPYRFFQGTADINAPPGLTKTENDSAPLTHRVRRVSSSSSKHSLQNPDQKTDSSEIKEKDVKENGEKGNEVSLESNEKDLSLKNKKDLLEDQNNEGSTTKSNDPEQNEETDAIEADSKPKSDDKEQDQETDSKETETDDKSQTEQTRETDDKSRIEQTRKTDDNVLKPESQSEQETNQADSECTHIETENEDQDEENSDEDSEIEGIEWDDDDDYLFYLEDILKRIHKAFYDIGVIPTNLPPEKSRAYNAANALGANVQTQFVPRTVDGSTDYTTHVIGAHIGTVKVRQAMKAKQVKIVNINWLWSCLERWERVEESLFPLSKTALSRDCSPDLTQQLLPNPDNRNGKRKVDSKNESPLALEKLSKKTKTSDLSYSQKQFLGKNETTKSQKSAISSDASDSTEKNQQFKSSFNPLFMFSDDDIANMDKEVEDLMEDDNVSNSENSTEDDEERDIRVRQQVLSSSPSVNSSSDESLDGESPKGWNMKKKRRSRSLSNTSSKKNSPVQQEQEEETENEMEKFENTMNAFAPESDSESYAESIGSADDEIAEAIEREFLF